MKKNYLFSAMMFVLVAFCSCTNTDYQKAIPAEATLVVKADFKSISEKADFKHSLVMSLIEGSLAKVVKSEDTDEVKEYVDDPMKMGIDFRMPLYFFMVGNETFGLTMKVNDEGSVKDFLLLLKKQGIASKPVEKDGLMCGTLLDDIHYAYDANSLLLLKSGQGSGATSRLTRDLMNLKEKDSFVSTDEFDCMNEEDKDIVSYSSGMMPKDVGALSSFFSLVLPPSLSANDLYFISWTNFENGRMMAHSRVYGKTDKAQKELKEMDKNFNTISGKYIGRTSEDLFVWFGTNVKGDWLLSKLKGIPQTKEMLFMAERAIDIEQMLKAMDGDVAIEIQAKDMDFYSKNPLACVAYAELNNSDFLADVDDWKNSMKDYGMTMRDNGENQYLLDIDGETYAWGVQDKNFYFASEKASYTDISKDGTALNAYKGTIETCKFFLYVDLQKISWADFSRKNFLFFLAEPLEKLRNLEVESASIDEVTMTVELKERDKNFLKQIL